LEFFADKKRGRESALRAAFAPFRVKYAASRG
jgi:hypothetical protein